MTCAATSTARTDATIGEAVRISVRFYDLDEDPKNPTVVTFSYKDPAGTVTTWIAGSDPEIVVNLDPVSGLASVGTYYADVELDAAGAWYWRVEGEGAVEKVLEGVVLAAPSLV